MAPDVGDDLPGLQAAVARRPARMLLEVLQQRSITSSCQGFEGADDFLVHRQREVHARQVHADLQAVEIGFVGAPGMGAHRVHDAAEGLLVFRGLGGVELQRALRVAHAQPAGGRQFGRAVLGVAELVRRIHARVELASVGVGEADVVVQVACAGLHRDAHALQQGHERVGLQRETLGLRMFVQGIAHRDGGEPFPLDLFQEKVQQRLVGAAKARRHARLRQPLLRRAAGVQPFEQPALHDRAPPRRRHIGVRPGVQRAVECSIQQCHLQQSSKTPAAA